MSSASVGSFRSELEAVRESLRESHLNALRNTLRDSDILEACREVGHKFRKRLLAPIVAVFHMIASGLWPDASFQAAWHVFGGEAVSSGSLSKARNRLPAALFTKLADQVARLAAGVSQPWAVWRGHRVVDFDGTCLSMEDNPELMAEFGTCNTKHGPGRFPLARMVVAMLWGTMTVLGYAVDGYVVSEQALAAELLPLLARGDLAVGDRHFAGANYYAKYLERGVEFLTRVHQRLKIARLKQLVTYSPDDFVVEMRVGKKHRREDPSLPKSVTVRLIRVEGRVRGKFKSIWLVTSLLDAQRYPAAEIGRLYAGRWRIETVFKELKVTSGADVLRSKKPDGIRNEIAARMMAMNLVRIMMIEAAAAHGKEPTRLSFSAALRLVISTSLRMSTAPLWELGALYEIMLDRIAAETIPERPGRNEPRMKRRETRHYEVLRTTRAEWRQTHAAA
jgi:hypothetical protein